VLGPQKPTLSTIGPQKMPTSAPGCCLAMIHHEVATSALTTLRYIYKGPRFSGAGADMFLGDPL
jgi:hypothetical protein